MGVNRLTALKVAKNPYKEYVTCKGNSYMAIPLFDRKGRKHGTAIYRKQNVDPDKRPEFAHYLTLGKFAQYGFE